MVAGIGPNLAKVLLWIFTFVVWVAGIILVVIGALVLAFQESITEIFGSLNINVLAGVSIGLGGYLFLVGFAGCCGASTEGTCLLKLHWALTLIIILAQITVGTLALVYSGQIYASMSEILLTTIQTDYGNTSSTTEGIDNLQLNSQCCGSHGYEDYKNATGWNEIDKAVPKSCCVNSTAQPNCNNGTKGDPINSTLIYTDGCSQVVADAVKNNYLLIGIICLCLIVFEILTMIFSCCIITGIKSNQVVPQ